MKTEVVKRILDKISRDTHDNAIKCLELTGKAFAPSNIALVKYWGKSNTGLNIPNTDSLSISLSRLGAETEIVIDPDLSQDKIYLNNTLVENNTEFYLRIKKYLDLFRNYQVTGGLNKPYNTNYVIKTNLNIPVAAGVASSACGFAALILALDNLYGWRMNKQDLSILARLGSGSASRSLWNGFVYWQKGQCLDGMDSYAYKLEQDWPELKIGILMLDSKVKKISSRDAMLHTVETSVLYQQGWEKQVKQDLSLVLEAIKTKNFDLLGSTAENNATAMHATMLAAKPAVCYSTQQTIETMQKVWQLREQGLKIYFTQDAGPNIKLLFEKSNTALITQYFPDVLVAN